MNKKIRVTYAQAVHDKEEIKRVIAVLKENRTIIGKETLIFEKSITKLFGKKYGIMVNSGSSANMLAFDILNLPHGSEIITPLLTFSTTVAPIVRNNLIPVFADVEEGKYVINVDQIERLITSKTKALMIPLLFGNVPDMEKLKTIANKYKLYLIEDSCDTLGAIYKGIPTGKYSDITTTSFYGSHIITAGGGGGMILFNNADWRNEALVLRGWGRHSSLSSESEDISIRFKTKLDSIPYDAKFVFDRIGYNFMPMEIGSAFGNAQLRKLQSFKKRREHNFKSLHIFFKEYNKYFVLPIQGKEVSTQWLAFPLTIRQDAPFSRIELVTYLEKNNIQTRPTFTGNILMQPGFNNIQHLSPLKDYNVTNEIMKRGFVVGCHHGLEDKHIEYMENIFAAFLKNK